jgi:hypothetical protein
MPWDQATYLWIQRLPEEPSSEDAVTLRVLRRTAGTSSEVRLVDSLLARSSTGQVDREREALQRRVRYLERNQSDEVRERLADQEAFQVKRLAQALRERCRIAPHDAEERAYTAISRSTRLREANERSELRSARRRLRELGRT